MLIEFRFENYRSFRDATAISMLPVNSYGERPENVHEASVPGTGTRGVLTAAAVYGANASGKTNLLRAAFFSRKLVLGAYHPAHLPKAPGFVGHDGPTRFGYTFFTDGKRFEYDVAIDGSGVLSEELRERPKAERLVFRRERLGDGTYEVAQGSRYSGIKTRLRGYSDSGLVLGMLANYGIEPCAQAMDWFSRKLVVSNREASETDGELMEKLASLGRDKFEAVIHAIESADLGIVDIQLDVDDISETERAAQMEQADRLAGVLEALTGRRPDGIEMPDKKVALQFRHNIDGNGVGFGFDDESLGTKTMLDLAVDFIEAIDSGKTLLVDEVERSLHPLLLESLVSLFFDPKLNDKGAQLVFTTHDLSFLRNERLRRDQVWFVEKDPATGCSDLYPLSSFSPRKDERLLNRYLHGAYGAVPYIDGMA